ncbi:MAG: DUF5685 family protein [Solirubrobacterales bacterium]
MFGYVTPCKMELKIKDYEKFRSYYCGVCKAIKTSIGNLPRFLLNYDMTFLAILLDSLDENKNKYSREHCLIHPIKKKVFVKDSSALVYAAYFNTILGYYKLVDNTKDDNSLRSRILSIGLKPYIGNYPDSIIEKKEIVEKKLEDLYKLEAVPQGKNIDELSHPFADLTGYILSSFREDAADALYKLGYNLGKWIYVIDAYDDLEKDMKNSKFNAINESMNENSISFNEFDKEINVRIDYLLTACGAECLNCLDKIPLKKNQDILYNILQYGLMEKMDKVFKRSCYNNEKSL